MPWLDAFEGDAAKRLAGRPSHHIALEPHDDDGPGVDLEIDEPVRQIGRQCQLGDVALRQWLEPNALPDPGRGGVEDPLGLFLPVLLAPGDRPVAE